MRRNHSLTGGLYASLDAVRVAAKKRAKALAVENQVKTLAAVFIGTRAAFMAACIAVSACDYAQEFLTFVLERIEDAQDDDICLTPDVVGFYHINRNAYILRDDAEYAYDTAKRAAIKARVDIRKFIDGSNFGELFKKVSIAERNYDTAAELAAYAAIAAMTGVKTVIESATQSNHLFRLAKLAEKMADTVKAHDFDAGKSCARTARITALKAAASHSEEYRIAAEDAVVAARKASIYTKLCRVHGKVVFD